MTSSGHRAVSKAFEDAASNAKRTCKIFACVARQGLIGALFETARTIRSCLISTQCRSCLISTTYRPDSSTPICRSSREASLPPGTHDGTFPTTLTTLPWLAPPAAPDMEELRDPAKTGELRARDSVRRPGPRGPQDTCTHAKMTPQHAHHTP